MALEREQVPANRKWRTEDIFATQEDWEALYGKVEAAVAEKPGFAAYQGKLTDAATVLECMEKLNAIMLDVIRLDVYAFMRGDEDTRKSEFVALKSRMSQLEMKLAAETAFITPELTSLPAETLEAFAADPAPFRLRLHLASAHQGKAARPFTGDGGGPFAGCPRV